MTKPEWPWLSIAMGEMDQKEIPGHESNPRIIEYGLSVDLAFTDDDIPWCSVFVNWCVREAGYAHTQSAAARSWLTWGKAIEQPQRGCVVVFKRGTKLWTGHVGFYIAENKDHIKILGGNQSNKVCFAWYPKRDLLGFRIPNVEGIQ